MLALLSLSACNEMTITPPGFTDGIVLASPAQTGIPCEACAQATLAAALTLEKNSANDQAIVDAGIVRFNAQATLDSANSTQSAAQTQEQSNADFIAGQIAATAAIERANAQATLNAASFTQMAAMTQSQYNLQSTMVAGTQVAQATISQQNKDDLAAATQTTVANTIATQSQSAAATSQWYDDQARQRDEQRQVSITFLWMWCLPIFVLLLAGLILWGFWRWLKIQQANQLVLENPAENTPMLPAEVRRQGHDNDLPYIESDVVDNGYQLTKPDDQVEQWLNEVKDKLLRSEEEDKNDDAVG